MRLADNRDVLYQWDTNRHIIAPDGADYVFFGKLKYGEAPAVEVIDGKAKIPDELLQSRGTLYIWVLIGSVEDGYTKQEASFQILPKPKPAEYSYTPTEIKSWKELEKEIQDAIKRMDEVLSAWSKEELVLWNDILSHYVNVSEVGL
jgi:hypothetical protein